jgi:cell wall-associated NlpC family hydrolase
MEKKKTIITTLITIFLGLSINIQLFSQSFDTTNIVKKIELGKNIKSDTLRTQADSIIQFASKHIGIKYKYAGGSPETGFDCSGFVNYVFSHFGYKVPRMSRDYDNFGEEISKENCKKGDVITFKTRDLSSPSTGHVGIVVSNENGKIFFIHSATSNSRGVVISDLDIDYYKKRLKSFRRIIK